MKTATTPCKLTLTVKRPGGEIEKVVFPGRNFINEKQFKQIQDATKNAGRGEVLSYDIEYKTGKVMSFNEMAYAGEDHTVENMARMGE